MAAQKKTKSFFLDQHGCAKNQVDGELIATRLINSGYTKTEDPSQADLIIINSCGFIESAKKESLDSLMGARSAYPDAKIILAGCLAERYAEEFKDALPEADGIFGNGDLSLIEKTAAQVLKGKRAVVKPEQNGVCCGDRSLNLGFKGSVFVKITEGCNNCCSFCAIPLIRGSLRSRNADEIISEIKSLVKSGVKEINLIGQDLAAYGTGKTDDVFGDSKSGSADKTSGAHKDGGKTGGLSTKESAASCKNDAAPVKNGGSFLRRLLDSISKIKGNFWIRLLYIHPDHFSSDILEPLKKDKRLLPYFDIPFQSGSSGIIKAMNRKGTSSSYKKLIKEIRTSFSESAIRTTFLTGFPGETDEDAENTESFLKAIKPDWSGCFTYSREEDTPAYKFKHQVTKKTAEARKNILCGIQEEITRTLLKNRTGKIYDVLVEEILSAPENSDSADEGLAIGRAWFQAPEVDGNVVIKYDLTDKNAVKSIQPGEFVKVHITSASDVDLDGDYCGKQ